ncbi:ParA family protein [Bacillus cereus group sp. BceL008]|uniref:ParA family protein n=1 Tax=Bacillus cereus group sp. BceL008 TaxID=3445220 RepID=UPI003F1F44F5
MSKVISFFNTKGGVGKTMSCVCAAYTLSAMGHSVLVIDMCANGDISNDFGFDRRSFAGKTSFEWLIGEKKIQEVAVEVPGENIHFIPADDKIGRAEDWINRNVLRGKDEILMKKLGALRDHFSYILIDCHPDQNDLQAVMSLVTSDVVYIPMTSDGNTVEGAYRSAKIVKQLQSEGINCEYVIVPTMIVKNDFGKDKRIIERIIKKYKEEGIENFSKTFVRHNDSIRDWTRKEKTFEEMKKHKVSVKMFKEYKEVVQAHVIGNMEGSFAR